MWFKNINAYRLTAPWTLTAEQLAEQLAPQAFTPCTSLDAKSTGWTSPRDNGMLVHALEGQLLLQLTTESKLMPASAINILVKARIAELEEQQGFKPGRKQCKEIKEQVIDETLPRALSTLKSTRVWIDTKNGWLVVDGTASRADEVFKMLLKSLESLPFASLRTERSPMAAMTDWLAADEAPAGFTVDQDMLLRSTGEGKAEVRYTRHTIELEDVRRHIAAGKQCVKLALTWADRVSFVLGDDLILKRVAPLDVLKENTAESVANEDERFDGDFLLMTGELAKMMNELTEALGGLEQPKKAA